MTTIIGRAGPIREPQQLAAPGGEFAGVLVEITLTIDCSEGLAEGVVCLLGVRVTGPCRGHAYCRGGGKGNARCVGWVSCA